MTVPSAPNWGPVLFLCAFLSIGGAFFYQQFRYQRPGAGSGVEFNQDGSIRSVADGAAERALRQVRCYDSLPADAPSSAHIDCLTLP